MKLTRTRLDKPPIMFRQIKKSAAIHNSANITAYVVGAAIGEIDVYNTSESGTVHVVTYGQLVDTASTRLFRLRDQLKEHYDSLGDESIVEKALKEPKQQSMDLTSVSK